MKKGFGDILNSETLSNSMIFTREDKITSSKHVKYELGVSKNQIEKSFWTYFIFIQIIFSKNKIYGK